MKRTINGHELTRYGVLFSKVERGDRFTFTPISTFSTFLQPTVSSVTNWIDETFPDLVLTFPVENSRILPDAIRAMQLYGFLRVDLKNPATNTRYEVRIVET